MTEEQINEKAADANAKSVAHQFVDWRADMLNRILLFAVVLGAFPTVWSIVNQDRFLLLYLAIHLFTIGLFTIKKLGYAFRVGGLLFIIYGIAVSEFAYGGITGGARIYLLSIVLMAGIFFSLRAGLAALALSVATIATAYFLIQSGAIQLVSARSELSLQSDLWVHYVLGLLLMAGCILMPLGSLLRQLLTSLQTSKDLVGQLEGQIVEKEQAQVDLMESEKRYRMVAGNIMDVVWVSDLDLNITFASPSLKRVVGFDSDDAIGMNVLKTVLPQYRGMVQHLLTEGLRQANSGSGPAKSVSIETELPRKDGSTIWTEGRATYIRDEHGEPVEILGVTRDISAQKEAEEERRNLEMQIRQSEKLKSLGSLAGGIAHDFNNILQAIFGYSDLALLHTTDNEVAHKEVEQVKQAAKRANELVQQILMFGRQGHEEFKLVHLDAVLNEALELMRASLPSTISIEKHVAEACDPVVADSSQLHQVIVNLCTNAFHAMQDAGGTLTVKLEPAYLDERTAKDYYNLSPGRYTRLTVKDTGHGISPEISERVFEPFFTTKDVGEGTGLGLSTVHGIVMKHGGDITLDSVPGRGTTFCVYLPAAMGDVVSDMASDLYSPDGREHVLLVDDEENLVALGERALTQLGYDVTGFTDSEKALEAFRAAPDDYHVVLTDQTMPNMTGIELAKCIKETRPDMPIILLTGYLESVPREKAIELGITTILNKPVRAREISAAIRKLMERV